MLFVAEEGDGVAAWEVELGEAVEVAEGEEEGE